MELKTIEFRDQALREKLVTAALLAGMILSALFGWCALRVYSANALSYRFNERSFRRAITMEPRNAAIYNLLCRYRTNVTLNSGAALPACKQATELNSYDAAYWLDLAQAYYDLGFFKEQRDAVGRAIAVDPKTPQVAWNAANFLLAQNDIQGSLAQFAVVLRTDPDLSQRVLASWRRFGNVEEMMRILPPDPKVYLDFIKLLLSQQQAESAGVVWAKLIQLHRKFDFHEAVFYVDTLLQAGNVGAAQEAWRQIGERTIGFESYVAKQNLVVNGSFENEILNSGFDWHYAPMPGVSVLFDPAQSSDGKRSLLVSYAGSGKDAGVYQLVPVSPDTEYSFSAFIRSDNLTSAHGPRLTIVDSSDGADLAVTAEASGTTGWQREETVFRTKLKTKLVSIRIMRDSASTLINGRMWIDNVQLVEKQKAASSGNIQ